MAADTLAVSTTGGTLTDTDTVGITVNAVNDAPVNTVPGAQSVNDQTSPASTRRSRSAGLSRSTTVDGDLDAHHPAHGHRTLTRLTVNGSLPGATVHRATAGTATLTLTRRAPLTRLPAALTHLSVGTNFHGSADI